jgi:hypothetical protein
MPKIRHETHVAQSPYLRAFAEPLSILGSDPPHDACPVDPELRYFVRQIIRLGAICIYAESADTKSPDEEDGEGSGFSITFAAEFAVAKLIGDASEVGISLHPVGPLHQEVRKFGVKPTDSIWEIDRHFPSKRTLAAFLKRVAGSWEEKLGPLFGPHS